MRLTAAAVAALLLLPVAWASHAVEHDPLGFRDPDGPLFAETCRQVLFDEAAPFPEVALGPVCEGVSFLAEVAADGYVLQVQRTAPGTFEVRVRHGLDLGLASGPLPIGAPVVALADVALDCATPAACDNGGVWVHAAVGDDTNAFTGAYYPQRITASPGGTAWTIDVDGPTSAEQVAVVVVVHLADGDWVRGFYHPAKLSIPLDALDAAPYPTVL